jgi:hypothetical protein
MLLRVSTRNEFKGRSKKNVFEKKKNFVRKKV